MSDRDELADIIKSEYRSAVTRKTDDCYTAPADAILAAGYRKPRTITTAEELDGLPQQTIIRAVTARNPKFGAVFERFLSGWLHLDPSDREDGESTTKSAEVLKWDGDKSVTVLYEPTA